MSVMKATADLIKFSESILKLKNKTIEILSLAIESVMLLGHINYYLNNIRREKTAHLVNRLACNTRLIVDASSCPPVSHIKIAVMKT